MKAGSPMTHRILSRIRANIVAYLALFLALTGTSVAAVSLANHSVDPIKLDPRNIGGYVREWASVNANGHVAASGGRVTVNAELNVFPGRYFFRWHTRLTSGCTVIGSVNNGNGATAAAGYLTAGLAEPRRAQPTTVVDTYNAQASRRRRPLRLSCCAPRRVEDADDAMHGSVSASRGPGGVGRPR